MQQNSSPWSVSSQTGIISACEDTSRGVFHHGPHISQTKIFSGCEAQTEVVVGDATAIQTFVLA